MTAQKWNEVIKKACKTLGTYHKAFDPVIDTLAGILEKRDDAADRLRVAHNVKRLDISCLVVRHTDDATALDQVVVSTVDRIGKVYFVDAISFFRTLAVDTVAQAS